MSNANQETIANIVAEIRSNEFDDPRFNVYSLVAARTLARGWADRIEAAAKREREAGADTAQVCGEIGEMIGREATRENSSQVGNAAKMRDALKQIHDRVNSLDEDCGVDPIDVRDLARAALDAPPRNCDIGTAEEQHERFYNFCDKVEECKECPLWRGGGLTSKCCAHWGQMPYEEGGAE